MDFTTTKAATPGMPDGEAGITAAVAGLIGDYEALERRMTLPAQGRRAFAMERLAAACFAATNEYLDPYGLDCLNERAAGEVLGFSLFVADLMVTAMLDFRERADRAGIPAESSRRRLHGLLLDVWHSALEELEASEDDDDQDSAEPEAA